MVQWFSATVETFFSQKCRHHHDNHLRGHLKDLLCQLDSWWIKKDHSCFSTVEESFLVTIEVRVKVRRIILKNLGPLTRIFSTRNVEKNFHAQGKKVFSRCLLSFQSTFLLKSFYGNSRSEKSRKMFRFEFNHHDMDRISQKSRDWKDSKLHNGKKVQQLCDVVSMGMENLFGRKINNDFLSFNRDCLEMRS